MQKKTIQEKNAGIELLRIVAMSMIVFVHIGGHYWRNRIADSNLLAANSFLNLIMSPCVDIFAMISGYILCLSKIKYSRMIELYFQCYFYSIVIMVFSLLLKFGNFQIKAFFPVLTNEWWYISCYFMVYLFIPFVNAALRILSQKTLNSIVITIFLFVCVRGIIFPYETLIVHSGYSPAWILCCYVFGAFLRMYQENNPINSLCLYKYFWMLYLSFVLLSIAAVYFASCSNFQGITMVVFNRMKLYISPLIVLVALAFVNFFSLVRIQNNTVRRLIFFFSPLTLGVYLIHDHNSMRELISRYYPDNPTVFQFWLFTVGGGIVIYVGCSFLDYLRKLFFQICKVKVVSDRLERLFGFFN